MQSIFGVGGVGALTLRLGAWFAAIVAARGISLAASGRTVWFTLDHDDRDGHGVEALLSQLEAVLSFSQELDRRLVAAGVDGLAGAVGLYLRLKTAIDDIPAADVARTQAALHALEHEVGALAQHLEELKRLKGLVTP